MTHIDISRQIRYRLLAELHRATADLYSTHEYGNDQEIRAIVKGYTDTLDSLYVFYQPPEATSPLKDESGPLIYSPKV